MNPGRHSGTIGNERMTAAVPEQKTFDVAGLAIAAQCFGPVEGTPVLALHGWLDSSASFERLAPLLHGCRVVAIDLPGHGLSQHRQPGQAYYFADGATVAFDIADSLGWSSFGLLGHSMGAGMAVLAAGACPDRIARVVLLDGLGPMTSKDDDAPRNLERHVRMRNRNAERRVYRTLAEAEARLMQAMPPLSRQSARHLAARGTQAVPGGFCWRADPRLREPSPLRFNESQVRAFLRRISAPTLLVRPRGGFPFEPAAMAERLACVPQIEVLEVEGGHHVHLDSPQLVAREVRQWLTGS